MKKRILSLILAAVLALSLIPVAAAANYSTDYSSYSAPGSSDYAYWSGSQVVRASGTTTSEVKWMQAALNYCIKYKGLSASYLDVDGSFGPASQSATKAFQRKYGLSVDGSFGPSTIEKMKEVLTPAPKPTPAPSTPKPAQTNYITDYNSYSTPGSSDYAYWSGSQVVRASGTTVSEVKWMQAALNYCIKYKGLNASYLDVEGSFGPNTEAATKAFQRKYGLSVDGSFGPSTIAKMKEVLMGPTSTPSTPTPHTPTPNTPTPNTPTPSTPTPSTPTPSTPTPSTPTPAPVSFTTDYQSYSAPSGSDYAYWDGSQMVRASGTTTSEVKWMQAALNYCIKYKGLQGTLYVDVTGSFDSDSQWATEVFQLKYGLSVDGSFGPATIAKMKEVLEPEPSSTPTPTPTPMDTTADTNYSRYSAPGSSDYAYWNGSRSVLGSQTTTSEVKWMQAALNYCIKENGLSASYLEVDGSFGPASKNATSAFQQKYGLSVDGSFGPGTITQMKKLLGIPVSEPTPSKNSSSSTTAIPYNAWVPVHPTYTNAAGSRSAEAYNRVIDQFEVERNGRYTPYKLKKGDTYCNIFAWDVSIAMGAEIAHWVTSKDGKTPRDNNSGNRELGANATYNWLKNYGGDYGWYTVSAREAQSRANQGYPTVGAYHGGNRVGHIVVVRPETKSETFSSSKGPVIAQAGSHNYNYYHLGKSYTNYTFYTHD